jgi:hypothetical protein
MRTNALICAAVLAVSASGCMTGTKTGPGKTFTYDCSGLGKGWGDCTDKADKQCGAHNYETISQTGSSDEKGAGGNTEMKRTLVVACR